MITGEKVYLTALNREDAAQILSWVNNPELKVQTGTVFPVSDAEHLSWFEKRLTEPLNKLFGIRENENQNLIGIIGFKNMDLINRSAELFIYIGDESYRNRGLGTDATNVFVKFSFEELNLHRIFLEVFAYNKRAVKSYEKAGFAVEGVLKDSVYKGGKYHDKVIMAMLSDKNRSL